MAVRLCGGLVAVALLLAAAGLIHYGVSRALGQVRHLAAGGERAGVAAEGRAAATWLRYGARMESLRAGSAALTRLTGQGSASAVRFYQASGELQARLAADARAAAAGRSAAVDSVITVAGVLAAAAALLGLAVALAVPLGITRPLRGPVAILRRLTAGDRSASAPETGPAGMREVARLYEAENRLVDELRAVDQVKSDFLATVSHELRTPLTSIAGYIEILRDRAAGPLTQAQDRMLDSVDRNTARLRHLIEDVLTLSKIESGAFTSMMRPVSLAEIVAADVAALQPAASAKGLTLSWQDCDHGLMVSGDPGQLDRLVLSLLSNAVKFTPEGGSVSVGTGSEGDLAMVRVSDTGIGIPEGERKELFTRFFRASNAVGESIPGTGLGLAIARTIVASHRGDLDVTSREGQGTTVTVRIPLLADQGAWPPLPDVRVAGESRPA